MEEIHADLASRFIIEGHTDGEPPSTLRTSADYGNYISARTQAWNAAAGNQRPSTEVG